MKRSVQGASKARPLPENKEIALILHCVTCGTLRAFKISVTLTALEARQLGSLGLESTCSVCARSVGATLAWIDNKKDWAYQAPPPMDAFSVQDGLGLEKPHPPKPEA